MMTEWTDKHYDFTYELTEEDISKGSLKIDPYFVAKQWKTGSKDDSGALFHVLKTVARFGDKNGIEREVKALHAQVRGVARSFGVELDIVQTIQFDETRAAQTQTSLWYPDDSGKWVETSSIGFKEAKELLQGCRLEMLAEHEREEERYHKSVNSFKHWDAFHTSWGNRVAFKVVE